MIYCSVLLHNRSTSVWAAVKSQQKVSLRGVIAAGHAADWTEDSGLPRMLTKWFQATRLETRTKESNMYASIWVANPYAKWKWKGGILGAPSTALNYYYCGVSMSIYARTRKMVNYTWIGWSQRKLWWRLAAVLTCKSIVKFGYRGERLIEPSSSWFPPKFPSG